jgi:O-antigen ligase/tetratricopeptide (TPR) repeat protein
MNKQKVIKTKQAGVKIAKPPVKPVRIEYVLILIAYTFVIVFTPNLNTYDSLGPKFLSLSLLNLVSWLIIFSRSKVRSSNDIQFFFFRNQVGFIYLLLMIISVMSFLKAYNVLESIIHFAKIFSVFTTAYIISVILRTDKRYLTPLALAMVTLLLVDSITVFYNISEGILAGMGPRIGELKSVYSNKNILSASIFIKIPFALWLFTFEKGYLKAYGILTVFLAFMATLFMSTRAFYLGAIFLFITYLIFSVIKYNRHGDQRRLYLTIVITVVTMALGFLLFNTTLKYLYPSDGAAGANLGFVSRLKTITEGAGGFSGKLRLDSWERTVKLIREEPVLGVGLGNWKIDVLKYENQVSVDYIYMYKNHNDFLEVTAETGILGGLLFLGIFFVVIYNFLRAFFRRNATEISYSYLFLPAFGLFCYAFDAFFNFPADRPEITALFAIYTGAGVAFSDEFRFMGSGFFEKIRGNATSRLVSMSLFLALMAISSWVLYQNFISLQLQRKFAEDRAKGSLTLPSSMFLEGFPAIPDLNVQGEPIAVHKARYLISEKKYRDAITILLKDDSSPYDTRPEFFLANCYNELGMTDSAIYYFEKVFRMKPMFYNSTRNYCLLLQSRGRPVEASRAMDRYLNKDKANAEAWLIAYELYEKRGSIDSAVMVLDSAMRYLPGNTQISNLRAGIEYRKKIAPFQQLYSKALENYYAKNYAAAAKLFTEFIALEPGVPEPYDFRAFCYYFLNEDKKGIADIDKYFTFGLPKPNLLNLRGVFNQRLGNKEAMCRDFDAARQAGDKDGESNYNKFCVNQKK